MEVVDRTGDSRLAAQDQQETFTDSWVTEVLAHPISKQHVSEAIFPKARGIIDARILLRNTFGFENWSKGQRSYERLVRSGGAIQENNVKGYQDEIEYDRPIYEHFCMSGKVLDVGGGVGTLREFLSDSVLYLSVDPYLAGPYEIPKPKVDAYSCLRTHLNFIGGVAEFLPVTSEEFDFVHMRSMLDHVQVPDLVLLEARRVLKPDGRLIVGIYVEGGKSGRKTLNRLVRDQITHSLSAIGIERFSDHHTWHPTLSNLVKLIGDNGFVIEDQYWQPQWNEQVVYIQAKKGTMNTPDNWSI